MFRTRLFTARPSIRLCRSLGGLAVRATICAVALALLLAGRYSSNNVLSLSALIWCGSFVFLVTTCALSTRVINGGLRSCRDRRVIIVGTGLRARSLCERLRSHPDCRYHVVGFVDSAPVEGSYAVLGRTDHLESILMRQAVDEVILALPVRSKYDEMQRAIDACERVGVQSTYSADLFSTQVTKRCSIATRDPTSVALHMIHNRKAGQVLKRVLDVVGAGLALLFLFPLMIVVGLATKFSSDGPILFCQERFGLNRRTFLMYKFRSMVQDAELKQQHLEHLNETDGPVFKIRNDPRITPLGRFLRRTSIDELPQLFNVLLGDMSLVGPRPLPTRDVIRFAEGRLMRRFSVRPGLTGLWQVSGRSNTTFDHWIKLDLEYIDRWSPGLDIVILARTLPAVFRGKGAA